MDNKQLSSFKTIILDFDGTIIELFKGVDQKELIEQIRRALRENNIETQSTNNPFDLFFQLLSLDLQDLSLKEFLLNLIDSKIKEKEIQRATLNSSIPGFLDFINFLILNKKKIAIVSNNSKEAIEAFLKVNNIKEDILILGRETFHPELMKPNPILLQKAIQELNSNPNETVYIGDHPNDYYCSIKIPTNFIGFAVNKKKEERLVNLNKDFPIVKSYEELIEN